MEDKLPLYTNFRIEVKSGKSLQKYFESLRKNLPEGWESHKDFKYDDTDSIRIVKKVIRLKSPGFKDLRYDKPFYGFFYLGLIKNSIVLLRLESTLDIPKDEQLEVFGFLNQLFHQQILKPNKQYNDFNHIFEYGGLTDANWNKTDLREARPIRLYAKKENAVFSLAKNDYTNIKNKKVSFQSPNNVSLCLSIMKKSYKRAKPLYSKLIENKKEKEFDIKLGSASILYDYFEEIQTCLIFSYTAIESLVNAAIPEDYQFERSNEKGIKEIWVKENIERWMSTSEKVGEILPQILKTTDPKKEDFWNTFKELENIRNSLIHQKTVENGTRIDSKIYETLLQDNIFDIAISSIDLIDFFYQIDNSHPYFPLGLGIAKHIIVPIDSMEKHFKPLKEEEE